jgi:hypothetical protein
LNYQNRNQYSNDEWLKLLEEIFVFDESSPEYIKIHINSENYVDPVVLEQINDPDLINVQKTILTGVFWDISVFSIIYEKLKEHT